jgi:2-hydroxychromene-2-carboxylate isomerase
MTKRVTFLYDFGSPPSYVAYKRLPAIAERTGATIDYRPVLVGGIFKTVGNQPPVEVPAKAAWFWADITRCAARHSIPFHRNPNFPNFRSLPLMRGAMVAEQDGQLIAYSDAVYEAMWVKGLNLSDPAIVTSVLTEADFDAKHIFAGAESDAAKAKLRAQTDDAIAQGVFGVPTFFVNDTMFFGQDRLDFVEEELAKA